MGHQLLTLLALMTLNSYGQELTEYRFDDNLTVQIPEIHQVTDTLGMRIIKAQIDNGLILISRTPNKGKIAVSIQNEKELIDFYKGLRNGILKSSKGELISEEIIEMNGLKLEQFSYRATMGEEKQIRHCLAIFVKENIYAIHFWELESMTNDMRTEREELFSSVKIPTNFGLKDQLSNSGEEAASFKAGYLVGRVLGIMLVFGILISLIVWITMGKKKNSTGAEQLP